MRYRPDTRVASVFWLAIGDERPQLRVTPVPGEAITMKPISHSILVLSACALALGLTISVPENAVAQISVSITLAPPALPVYAQPALVEEGGIWAPGYWDYDQTGGYFWVPGTWVQPPEVGLLWTPGYWGWGNGSYAWNEGYWGPTVGFYGGISYGFGYSGQGYSGGHWQGQQFFYNTAVSRVNVTNIHNTYTQTVVNNTTVNRVSYNGGKGGITARPTAAEQAAASAPHHPATATQMQHRQSAMSNHALFASVNHGKPPIAATSKPAELSGSGVVKASAAGSPKRVSKPVEAAKASKPVEAEKASKPVETTRASKPVEAEKASKPVETTRASKPVEAEKASKPVETTRASKPVETAKKPEGKDEAAPRS